MGFSRQEYWSGVPLPSLISLLSSLQNCRKDNVILCKLVLLDDMTPVRTMGILCHHRSDSLLTEPQGSLVYTTVYSERKWKWSGSVVSDSLQPQATPSMGFSRQEYWRGLPFPSPGNFPIQGSNPGLPHCRQTLYHLSHREVSIVYSMCS